VARMIDEHAQAALFKTVLYSTWLTFAGVLGLLLLKSPARDEYAGIDGSLLLIGMLMLSPMTSRSHYVVLVLPYMMLAAAVVRDPATRPIGIPVLAASFVLCTATSNDVVGQRMTEWAYFYSLMPLGAIALMIYLAAIIQRAPQPAVPHAQEMQAR